MTKTDIGAIRIQSEETFVELKADCVDRFVEAIGPDGMVEEMTQATRLNAPPMVPSSPRRRLRNAKGTKVNSPSTRSKRYEKFDKKSQQKANKKGNKKEEKEQKGKQVNKNCRVTGGEKEERNTKDRKKTWDRRDPKARNPKKRSWTTTHGKPITETADEVYARRNAKQKARDLGGLGEAELGSTIKKKRKKKKVNKNKGKKRLKLSKASGEDGFGPRKRKPRKPGNS